MSIKKFHEVFAEEVAKISERREANGRTAPIKLEQESTEHDGTPVMRPTADSKVIGLALSGGGIRSAAFCLGAMQALNERGIIKKVDYLSTVSGGGYIGTSMTAAMSAASEHAEQFPFTSTLQEGEVPAMQHIRDHSNYLFPQGLLNLFSNIVVYLRGLAANIILLLPWLMLAAAVTIWSNPDVNALTRTNVAGLLIRLPISVPHFGLTLNALLAYVILLAGWGLWRSTPDGRNNSDIGPGARFYGILLVIIIAIALCELQPLVLSGMLKLQQDSTASFFTSLTDWLKPIAAFFASVGTVVGFFGRFLADSLKRTAEKPGIAAFLARIAIKLVMYMAGAAVPLALWVVYLYLSMWGIQACDASGACATLAPAWLTELVSATPLVDKSLVKFYGLAGFVLLVIGWLLSPNANSLHRLYRDRLGKAFLFDPTRRVGNGKKKKNRKAPARNRDLQTLDNMRVSEISTERAPYHLINTALNIAASKYANRRGRNAEFFIFSPLFTGSEATGYVDTKQMEKKMKGLTAGTAMAVSGAAASSNMGSATIKPLVPTLAILNVRLGYWLTNPAKVAGVLKKSLIFRLLDKLYFVKEILGLLREDSETIYLTDGGHVENLGVYELLRRRCKLIIAIDGEADPDMSFGSLITLQRYARIDFSARIDLPWSVLRDVTREAAAEILKSGGLPPGKAPHGPHCALGTIYYPRKIRNESDNESTGVLLYVKSSLTGDENDYVVDYKRRNPAFPHETTADQLFSEEQFEVYRSLGFHAINSAFKGTDKVAMNPDSDLWQGAATKIALEKRMLDILG
jgi:hypothetical protein